MDGAASPSLTTRIALLTGALLPALAGCPGGGTTGSASMGPGGGTNSTFTAGDGYEFHVTGPEGGPFPEGRRYYWVKNETTDRVLRWGVSATVDWLTFSEKGGLLGPGARTEVLVQLEDDYAATLPVGEYPADIIFRDARTGVGEIYLSFLLTVLSPSDQSLVVTPDEAFTASGPVGGPLDQETKVYYLENQGAASLDWTATASEPWIVFQGPTLGTLLPKERTGVLVAIDSTVHGLGSGTHQGKVAFENLGDSDENTFRDVIVTLDSDSGGDRVTEGLQVLYDFSAGSGSVIEDKSGVTPPLNLQIADTSKVQWLPTGLNFAAPTIAKSTSSVARLSQALGSSNALTLEAWIDPANLTQDGPARILTLSNGSSLRNFTLGQGLWGGQPSDTFNARLRTTTTDNDGMPLLTTAAGAAKAGLQHVVYTRDSAGVARIYVDATQVVSGSVGGNLSNWDSTYGLALGNEIGAERPWLGIMHLAAVYSRALSQAEVTQNFQAGPGESDAGQLAVDPYSDFTITGTEGLDDFSTPTTSYTLSNPGNETIEWRVGSSQPWAYFTSSPTGTLAPGAEETVGVAVDMDVVKTFTVGTYTADLGFTNTTNNWGSTTRKIIVKVNAEGGGGGGYDDDRPGPDNTGPYDESILVPSGSITVTQNGAVIENVSVTGSIVVKASNVTIRNFRIDGQGRPTTGSMSSMVIWAP